MRVYKATTPTRRHFKNINLDFLSSDKPAKGLILPKTSKQGRNNSGRITSRFRGGKGKRLYRNIDWWYGGHGQKANSGVVLDLFYDPNRTAYLALISYLSGILYNTKRFVIATQGLRKGDIIDMGADAPLQGGNMLPLSQIPPGAMLSCVELVPGRGAQLVRSAGTKATLLLKDKKRAAVKLPSEEVRLIPTECFAVLGPVNSPLHKKTSKAKAGRARWGGRRPKVRGSAMNPIDHPHGGGEGRCSIGRRTPYTRWGKPAFGIKTRKNCKPSSKMILKRRLKSNLV